ncbi:hypothetical protein GCM10023096_28250 [Nonomuraea ferruginea]
MHDRRPESLPRADLLIDPDHGDPLISALHKQRGGQGTSEHEQDRKGGEPRPSWT